MAEAEPDSKRQRVEEEEILGEDEAPVAAEDGLGTIDAAALDLDQAVLDEYINHQKVLDQVTEECNDRILQVEHEYATKKRPLFEQRSSALRKMPGFWKRVLMSHPQFQQYISEADGAVLDYLLEVDLDDSENRFRTGWKVRFVFEENPFFENTEVVKEYSYADDNALVATCTELRWRPGKEPASEEQQVGSKRSAPENEYNLISSWLKPEPQGFYGGSDPLVDWLRDEIWPHPLGVLQAAAAGDYEEPEDEGEEEEEGDDEEGDLGGLQEGEEEIEVYEIDEYDAAPVELDDPEGVGEGEEQEGYEEGAADEGGTAEGEDYEGKEGDLEAAAGDTPEGV